MRYIGNNKKKTALSFDQPGDFYYRRAMKFVQKDEYEKAVFNIRKAIGKDRKNMGYILDFAGLLTEIEHFDDSNDLLFSVLRKSGNHTAECYFGLGCNFYGLSDYKKASSSLNKYLSLSPDGEYAEDAEIMLDNINYDMLLSGDTDDKFIYEWKNALNEGDSKNALEILNSLTDEDAYQNVLIRNNLAVAYILENEIEKAQEICSEILHDDPFNIHALCNMSMIQTRKGDKGTAKTYILTALNQAEYDYGELLKISVALCDLNMHEEAVDIFYELLEENPYDLNSRHFLAIALYNLGEYESALSHFKFIAKFNPESSVNNWYVKTVNEKISGKNDITYFSYVNQVSSECLYRRINRINEILKDKSIENPWELAEFRELVLWAFDIKDDTIKTSMITLIVKYAGSEAPPLLHSKLCSRHVNDEIKHRILMSLKRLGEKEPYIALMDDNIVEVNVNTFEVNASKNFDLQREIIETVLANMPEKYDIDYFKYIIEIWNIIVAKNELFDEAIDCKLWAAVLEFNYEKKRNSSFDPQEISIKYSIDINDMISLYKKIQDLLKEE